MSKAKDSINDYLVGTINQLLTKLNLETIQPDEFLNLSVCNTDDIFSITVVCTNKSLLLSLNDNAKKMVGGWKHY